MKTEIEPIKIVTDSTADLPENLVRKHDIDVIPTIITFGDRSFRDRVNIGMAEFLRMLEEEETLPTTAAPGIQAYLEVYQKYPGKILTVHVGSGFSRVLDGAITAAREINSEKVEPYDSGTVSLGLGFLAIEAARLSSEGYSREEIKIRLDDMKERIVVMATLNTIEFLRRGGRASNLQAWLGSTLQIKPILRVDHNTITSLERPRTRMKSLQKLFEIAKSYSPFEKAGIMHAGAEREALEMADRMNDLSHGKAEILVTEIGSVVATHSGPGAVGVCVVQKRR